MVDAWGGAWGSSWGVSWGGGVAPDPYDRSKDDGGGSSGGKKKSAKRKRNKLNRDIIQKWLDAKDEEAPPAPTPQLVKIVHHEIQAHMGGLAGSQRLAKTVNREVIRLYQPDMNWGELARAFEQVMRIAAEEAEEIEDEDFILMFA